MPDLENIDFALPDYVPSLIIGGIFILCGVFLRLRSHWRIRKASAWRSVTGTVVHSSISCEQIDKSRTYRAIVNYDYRVGGVELTGGRIFLIDDGKRGTSKDAGKDMLRYPPGALVQVHYDPAVPGISCLVIDGPLRGSLYVMALGLAMAVLGPYLADWY